MYRTGETIYMQVISFDEYNNPVSGATFDTKLFKDNSQDLTTVVSSTLTDAESGVFSFYFTPTTFGDYQVYCKNDTTNILFMSDVFQVVADDFLVDTNIYVGL